MTAKLLLPSSLASVHTNTQACGVYNPPPVSAIPILRSAEHPLRYVARENPQVWVEAQDLRQETWREWACYHEPVTNLDDADLIGGIYVEITPLWRGGARLAAHAFEPIGYGRQRGLVECLEGFPASTYERAEQTALDWIGRARDFIRPALCLTDEDERLLFRRIFTEEERTEYEAHMPLRCTVSWLSSLCQWTLGWDGRRRPILDTAKTECMLQRLLEKGMIIGYKQDGKWLYSTPAYLAGKRTFDSL